MKFFKECINELKITQWPNKKYMGKYSIATFSTIITLSLYFYLITILFLELEKVLNG